MGFQHFVSGYSPSPKCFLHPWTSLGSHRSYEQQIPIVPWLNMVGELRGGILNKYFLKNVNLFFHYSNFMQPLISVKSKSHVRAEIFILSWIIHSVNNDFIYDLLEGRHIDDISTINTLLLLLCRNKKWFCSVDHGRCQNVVRKSVMHLVLPQVCFFLF